MPAVTVTIRSEGQIIDPAYIIAGLEVVHEIDRIPYAQLRLFDGDFARREFPILDALDFEPGKHVEIDLRYEGGNDATVFSGVVVSTGLEASTGGSILVVGLKSKAICMTFGRKSGVFHEEKDDQVISDLINRNDLSKGDLSSTQTKHLTLVQYNCTDWDFMLSRADANGMLVNVSGDEVSVVKIVLDGSAKHTFDCGIDTIYEIDVTVDAQHQLTEVESVGWDSSQQKCSDPATGVELTLRQGNLKGNALATALCAPTTSLNGGVPLAKTELQAWSDALLARSRMALIRGRLSIPGRNSITVLDLMEIKGLSKRFTGTTLVTGVRHVVDDRGWRSDIQLGLSPQRFSQRSDVIEPPACGLLPAVHGMQIGVVAAYEDDPDSLYRVKVNLVGMTDGEGSVWARLAMPDGGNERGFFFWPEPGDEVVIGFVNGDPRHAIILGSLYSGKNALPQVVSGPSSDNFIKTLTTRSGITITFDDEKAALRIETPAKNSIVLNDDSKLIEIADQHGNMLTLEESGITLKSAKDFTVDAASGSVTIKGKSVDVE